MNVCVHPTGKGKIVYWRNEIDPARKTLVFLPGLTADHRLFDKQTVYFADRTNVLVWDAPGHADSRPFELSFTLDDQARWLHEILETLGVKKPILVGQSMGGYVAQCFMELYRGETGGFVSIDSCPLQRRYVSSFELWALKHVEPLYRMYPWKLLLRSGAKGCAEHEYGQNLMRAMMMRYEKEAYCALAGHGFRMLAQAYETNRAYNIDCPALILCGEKDKAGSAKRINRVWEKVSGLPVVWLEDAGHNANTDKPEAVNAILERFVQTTERGEKA